MYEPIMQQLLYSTVASQNESCGGMQRDSTSDWLSWLPVRMQKFAIKREMFLCVVDGAFWLLDAVMESTRVPIYCIRCAANKKVEVVR